MTILPKAIYRFTAILIKIPMAFFTELEQKNLKICMETQNTPNSQSNLEKEKWSWRNQAPWLQTILQSYSHQIVRYWYKNRTIDQWNRVESPEINPGTCGQLIYDRGGKTIQWWKDSLFNKWCWENWTATCKKTKLGASLVAQWLRICLLMQATQVRALVWEDPTCRGATGPVSHSYWACASGACAPQQERPR